MKNKNNFIGIAEKVFHSKNEIKNPQIMNPGREWATGLLIGFLIFGVTTVWSVQTYLSNRTIGESDGSIEVDNVVIYREAMVESALESFAAKASKQKQLLNNTDSLAVVKEEAEKTSSSSVIEIEEEATEVENVELPVLEQEEINLEDDVSADPIEIFEAPSVD
ncbi:hypothetical protein H6785_01480 [Candidatus Nomurabacteria bacterium]|nr:hypothetical protein [Candidatus Kaiserbacteria bacterium]MCB9815239.1 hypothetical protein [Candidatus Nomurabacteria bacterium]